MSLAKLRQFSLAEYQDGSRLVCWLEDDPRLKEGIRVTLKEIPNVKWTILKRYTELQYRYELNKKWNVGGLE